MLEKKILLPALAAALLLAAAWSLRSHFFSPEEEFKAWGNVDTREISLAFEASGRIARLGPEEGEAVRAGDVIGRLDTESLEISLREAEASLSALTAEQSLKHEGYRKEDVEAQRRSVESLEAQLSSARRTAQRQKNLLSRNVTTAQAAEDALYRAESLSKELAAARAQLKALEAGFRPQEIAAADAQVDAARARVDALRYQIEKASVLKAPVSGLVRTRAAEPGDMASPSRTVYRLSIVDPKWVRCWVPEVRLGLLKEGSPALVRTDTTDPVEGRVAHVSSTAEFTPKTVQTEDLRTVLVYEVKLIVPDPENRLRLGQPVTVEFPTRAP